MRLQTPAWLVGGLAVLVSAWGAGGQSSFQNLGFESASLVPIPGDPYGRVQFATAFPGWTGLVGGEQQTAALYNNAFLGTSAISIIDSGWSITYPNLGGVISGNFTAILQAGVLVTPTNYYPADATLSQTALVPATAESLRFRAYDPSSLSPGIALRVTLGGQQLSLNALGSGANYTLYGADIHTLAGQSAELDFTVPSPGNGGINYVFLDSIQFSTVAIPEPDVFGLCALGAMLLGWRFGHKRQ